MSTFTSNFDLQPVLIATLYLRNIQVVKDNLTCHQHPGESQWCWVDPHNIHADHIPLCLGDIQLWASYLCTRPEQTFCRTLPNTKHFNQLLQTRQPRNVSPTPTRLNTPISEFETIDLNAFVISADNDGVVAQMVADRGVVFGPKENEEIKE